jgi:tRNA pseudouridine13 synthase
MIQHERMAVLWADLHTNKLRQGHLKGNRFSIKVRATDMSRALHAKRVLDQLVRLGVPNAFGEQRFGAMLNNHLVGRELILGNFQGVLDLLLLPEPGHYGSHLEARQMYARGDLAGAYAAFPRTLHTERTILRLLAKGVEPKHAIRAAGVRSLAFYVSSWQSAVFNRVLERRITQGTFATFVPGDLAMHVDSRNTFQVTEEELSREETTDRLASFEISPTGPMWGARMRRASGAVDAMEVEALKSWGVTIEQIEAFDAQTRDMIEGARRPLRVRLSDADVEGGIDEHGHYVRCVFDLPRGAFATTVMREVIKPASAQQRLDEEE